MTLMKRNPSLLTRFPRWFDDFMTRDMFDLEEPFFVKEETLPAVNIFEQDKEIEVELAAPGMKKADFKIELDNNILTISAEKKEEKKEEEKNYHRREYNYTRFMRSFTLPKDVVDADKIKANYKDGVLHLAIPKKEIAIKKAPKKIEIA